MRELLEPSIPSMVKLQSEVLESGRSYKECLKDFCESDNRMSLSLLRKHALDLLRFGPKALPSLKALIYATHLNKSVKSANANALDALAKIANSKEAQFRIGPKAIYGLAPDVTVPGFSGLLRVERGVATLIYLYAWKKRLSDELLAALSFGLQNSLVDNPDYASLGLDIYDLSATDLVRSPRVVPATSLADGKSLFQSIANDLLSARAELLKEGYVPSTRRRRRGEGTGGERLI